jgi:hypothetical protein
MVDYKQILRLRAEGVSQRGIADVLGCSRNTVAAVFAAATAAGIGRRARPGRLPRLRGACRAGATSRR